MIIVEETKKEVMNMLKKTIRPEFLNRIDETIMFLPLTEPEIKQIVVLQIKSVQKMLSGNGLELVLTNRSANSAVWHVSPDGHRIQGHTLHWQGSLWRHLSEPVPHRYRKASSAQS